MQLRRSFSFYFGFYCGIPMLLGQQIWGLCGTWAPLHGEPSTSGSSFSWNGSVSTKEDDTWPHTPPGSKPLHQESLSSPHFLAVFRYFCFIENSGFFQVLHLIMMEMISIMLTRYSELCEHKLGCAWWMFIWAQLATYAHIEWDFWTFFNRIWSLIKDKADVSMAF